MSIGILSTYGTVLLRIFVFVAWFVTLYHLSRGNINRSAVKYFVIYIAIFLLWGLLGLVYITKPTISRIIYSIFWTIISVYGYCFFVNFLILFYKQERKREMLYIISISVLAIPTFAAVILMHTKRTYSPINTVDFFNIIIQLFLAIVIIHRVLILEKFQKNIESFFIFSGFILYFGLHILASNVINLDFLRNWNFAKAATIVSLIYWLGSVFLSWRIRSKYL